MIASAFGLVAVAVLAALSRAGGRRRGLAPVAPGSLVILSFAGAAGAGAYAHLAPAAVCALCGAVFCADTDARTGYIFNEMTAAIACAGGLTAVAGGHLIDASCGALSAGGVLFALHALTRGRGMGFGDVKLAAALGSCLGVTTAVAALAAAFIFGAAYGIALLLRDGLRRGTAMPFAPFLAFGAVAAVFFGPKSWLP